MGIDYAVQPGQSLDDMAQQADKTDPRRKSMPAYGAVQMDNLDPRRFSMMGFGTDMSAIDFDSFQFNPQTGAPMTSDMMRGTTSFPHTAAELPAGRMGTASNLAINTQFANQNNTFANMHTPNLAYPSPMHPNTSLGIDMNTYQQALSMPLGLGDNLGMMGSDMGMFSGAQFASPVVASPMNQDFMVGMQSPLGQPGSNVGRFPFANTPMGPPSTTRRTVPVPVPSSSSQGQKSPQPGQRAEQPNPTSNPQTQVAVRAPAVPQPSNEQSNSAIQQDVVASFAQMNFPWTTPTGGFPGTMNNNPHTKTEFKNAYSSSGFDMLGTLMRVATRPDPKIDIGSVDMSCAFVVCDAQSEDCPIVYCSENFERLTGYARDNIVGVNCRFLQSPDGRVDRGSRRLFSEEKSINYLRDAIEKQEEAQVSLVNYRYGGQPFVNMLTMIPIAWEPGGPIRFFVGFQVDIVEQPGSVRNKNIDGFFRVDYQRAISMPSYIFKPDMPRPQVDAGQSISKDEVSNILSTYGTSGGSEIASRIWDKVLLENADDVIHVLSLKGLFLYLSPSSNRVLEYDPSELVGTSLSSICHPSDIVPVTRELKETTNGVSVNVVFRVRRKKSGYMWFEGYGSLHTEQGKGRKCIILVGRKRPVYALSKTIVREAGGIGDNELWSKMSTSGMFLFVSGNVRQLLDRQPEELVGTSIQSLMRPESKANFSRMLEVARTGRKAEAKHEMMNRRGQVLQAYTTIYPGDAVEGEKPTFMVAQTRLLKYTRSAHGQRPSMYNKSKNHSGDSRGSVPSLQSEQSSAHLTTGGSTPLSIGSGSRAMSTDTAAIASGSRTPYPIGRQELSLASEENVFDELKTTRSTSWQYELRQMEKRNRYLAEEVQSLLAAKKKRKRRKGAGQAQKDCANCHTRTTPEWRRGPSGNRDLCNSCGLRWAKQMGRVSPRNSARSVSDKGKKASPRHTQNSAELDKTAAATAHAPGPLAPGEKRQPTQADNDSHAAKVARLESRGGDGLSSGVPPKIDEVVEPAE
ncbi:hypothetical protein M011DRAFT_494333 [Sporormia fimetaria CBS 119925]|uniref:White collar n=1 Tax=Sporormia fimetaria CBS 119925 TaxID=1340428 RepID=A0A6A6VBT2_9PLEO|nr:hypothetical protein M011DRAFT_494333 [Sporormia fimetaria CBS 119925]